MYKKWLTLFLIFGVLVAGYTARIYGKPDTAITAEEIQNPNDAKNKEMIAQKVLTSTGRQEQFDIGDATNVNVYYGDVLLGDSQDAIISVKFGPKNTIVAAYTPNGEVYEFVAEVGEDFYDVRNVQFIPVKGLENSVVIVKQYADQKLGAIEENTFFKGYHYKDGKFDTVLNTPEDIRASWNKLWDLEGIQDENNWHRVDQKTESKWEEGDNPALNLVRNQRFSISDDKGQNLPTDETFQTENERVVTQKFYWSDEWGRFILGEKQDKTTGQKVAVIEDFQASPYILTGDVYNKTRILRKDGTYDIVDNDTLTDVSQTRTEPVFQTI